MNVFGGTKDEAKKIEQWWLKAGYDVRVTAGPALVSTLQGSGGKQASDQVYTPVSLMTEYKKIFNEVYNELMDGGTEQDLDDMATLVADIDGPKWNSHSCRRGGTKRAREIMHDFPELKITEQDIDRHFRWQSDVLTREQQVAYAGMLAAEQRRRVTEYF